MPPDKKSLADHSLTYSEKREDFKNDYKSTFPHGPFTVFPCYLGNVTTGRQHGTNTFGWYHPLPLRFLYRRVAVDIFKTKNKHNFLVKFHNKINNKINPFEINKLESISIIRKMLFPEFCWGWSLPFRLACAIVSWCGYEYRNSNVFLQTYQLLQWRRQIFSIGGWGEGVGGVGIAVMFFSEFEF